MNVVCTEQTYCCATWLRRAILAQRGRILHCGHNLLLSRTLREGVNACSCKYMYYTENKIMHSPCSVIDTFITREFMVGLIKRQLLLTRISVSRFVVTLRGHVSYDKTIMRTQPWRWSYKPWWKCPLSGSYVLQRIRFDWSCWILFLICVEPTCITIDGLTKAFVIFCWRRSLFSFDDKLYGVK